MDARGSKPSTSRNQVSRSVLIGAIGGTTSDTVDKRGERVRAMFAGIAKRYDLLNHLLSLNVDKRWRRQVVRSVPPANGFAILDVCTGTGDLAFEFARSQAKELRITGCDFCREMLDIAVQKDKGQGVDFREEDAQSLSFPDEVFDIVTCAFGLRNVADTGRALTEFARVAKPGGRVAILEFSRPRLPGLRWLYLAYFKHVLPRIGQSVAKNDHGAYEYLPASVMQFPDGEELAAMMRDCGLCEVQVQPLTFGVATLYVGQKR